MEFILDSVQHMNWLAVLVASLVPFIIGFVWYSYDYGFGKRWSKLVGLKKSDLEKTDGMVMTFGVLAIFAVATAVVLAGLLKATGTVGVMDSLVFGVVIGVVLRGGAHFIHNGFAKRPVELTLLDVGHDMISVGVMAAVLGAWV